MKRLRKLITLVTLLLIAVTMGAQDMQMLPIPVDKDVRIGKLDNGLTYYIRHNNWPEHQAEFYIAQKVGSLQENDDQRGLAHFLEHMCFNGTKHFKGNDLLRYCESIGVKFGRDLNAYTSIDQTVYNISNVPTQRQGVIDSCLLILYDWADGLTLDPKEIDKERGVINEEWRLRTSAVMRMFERNLPTLYGDSKYGQRMPIGLMSIINSFKPQVLQDYYEKWYRPDNQGIIVVGDVDVDHVEAEIKKLFGGIAMPKNPAKVELAPVSDNATPIVVIDKDKEMPQNIVELLIKQEAAPDSLKKTLPYLIVKYAQNAVITMLNSRLDEAAQKSESPFVGASSDYGNYIFARTKDAFELDCTPKEGQTVEALAAAYRELLRAARFGFTPTEYKRFTQNYLSELEKAYSNKDKRYNRQFCNAYKENFLEDEPIPSIDDLNQIMTSVVPMLPVEAINSAIKEMVPENDSNLVILSFNTEKDGNVYPTREQFLKAIANVRAEQLTAYVDNVKDEPLITNKPKAGRIVKEVKNDKFGYSELTLSNGATVVLKKTDYKKDQVMLSAKGQGGQSLYNDPKDYTNLKLIDDVIEASGLGNFSHTELEKALAGKIASASYSLDTRRQTVRGSSTPKDVETMLQLVYLYFTHINKDQESFNNLIKSQELALKNKALSPDMAFSDSMQVTMMEHNPRFAPLSLDDLKQVDYDRILQIAQEGLSNAAAFTFTIIGNYDEATIRPLIEQYIASLPAQKKVKKGHDIMTRPKGVVVNSFKRKMETPKAMAVMQWSNEDLTYSLDNDVKIDMAGQILTMIYLDKIREKESAAYTCGASADISRLDEKVDAAIIAYCPMKPEKADIALKCMREEVDNITKTCDEGMLNKVKEYMLKNFDEQTKTNRYWANVITYYRNYGIDLYTDYKKTVEAQTPATISAFMKTFLKPNNRIEVVMMPEK